MKCATNKLRPKWNAPDHGESWTDNHLHSGRKRTVHAELPWWCRQSGKANSAFYSSHVTTCRPITASFFAINWPPTCWYVA